jgi:superfamily II DNA or RNA helicase
MLSNIVSIDDIQDFVSHNAFTKALAYHRQGRVSGIEISGDFTTIGAAVRGSGREIYAVHIELFRKGSTLFDIEGACSCPVGYNCKHIAATLLEALAIDAGKAVAVPTPPGRLSPPPMAVDPAPAGLPPEISAWLDRIGKTARGDDYPPDVNQRLLYLLKPGVAGQRMPYLSLTLLSVRLLKSGVLSDVDSTVNLQNFHPDRAPKFYRDADIEIILALIRQRAGFESYAGPTVRATEVVQQMVATGRAYWLDRKGAPLQWGDSRDGRVEWRLVGKAEVRPFLIVDGMQAMNAEPPIYVDETADVIGPVDAGLPARSAHHLLAAPAIAPGQVAMVANRLGMALPGIRPDLLPVPPEPAPRIAENPVPVLRLGLARSATYQWRLPDLVPTAQLSFRYGPAELGPFEKQTQIDAFHDGRLYTIERRPAREKEAFRQLAACGLVEATHIYPHLATANRDDFGFADPEDWLDFLHVDAALLTDQGFEIQIATNFPYRLAKSSGVFDAEIDGSGIDWFELGLGIEIDGERHDLAPVLAEMVRAPGFDPDQIASLAEGEEHLYLSLGDGRRLPVVAARFVPLLLALHSINLNGMTFTDARRIRLSRAEIMPLLGPEMEDFGVRGADSLRRLAGLLHSRGLAEPLLPEGFGAVLRPYQAQGVAWLDLLRESGLGGILADDMGLGKTVQILALLALEKARGDPANPVLIVAPTSLMSNWLNEARKFAPGLKILLLHGSARKEAFGTIGDHDVVLTTYPLIARDHAVLLARYWHMAILDEAQTIKNPNAATTRWLSGIKAKHRFCLTGTPMENHLGELWSLMSFANPGYLGDRTTFARNWRTPIEKRGEAARSAALAQRVRPFLLRRTKAEVATELPPKTEIVETILLEGKQRDLYDSVRLAMSQKVREAISERGLGKSHIIVLEALLKLRQACCDPRLLKLDDGIERPSAKLERLLEMVSELLSEGRKIIVFSQFTSMLDLVRTRFDQAQIRYSLLTGKTKDRPGAIDRFQSGASDVFLISLKAGGVGLNLTTADTVVIFDPWWNPAVEEQAIDRAYRIGQDKAVFVYRLVAAGTIEEKMDELKARKRALADSLFDRDGQIGAALTEEDVAALFAA